MEEGKTMEGMCPPGMCGRGYCGCMHHKMKPFFVFLLGLTIVAGGLGYFETEAVAVIAGALIALTGLQKMFAGMCKCC